MHWKLIPNKFFLWGFQKNRDIFRISYILRKMQKRVHQIVSTEWRCVESLRSCRDDLERFGIHLIIRKKQRIWTENSKRLTVVGTLRSCRLSGRLVEIWDPSYPLLKFSTGSSQEYQESPNLLQIGQSLKGVAHGTQSAKLINYFLFNFNLFVLKGRMSLKGGIRYFSSGWSSINAT